MKKEKKKFKLDAKKCRVFAIICFVICLLCLIGFGVSGIANRSSSAEKFLNKYEKICQNSDREKLKKLYVKGANLSDPSEMSIPYEGKNPEFLFEDIEKVGDKEYELTYSVYYEQPQNSTVDGNAVSKQISFCVTGETISLHRNFFGFKINEEGQQ